MEKFVATVPHHKPSHLTKPNLNRAEWSYLLELVSGGETFVEQKSPPSWAEGWQKHLVAMVTKLLLRCFLWIISCKVLAAQKRHLACNVTGELTSHSTVNIRGGTRYFWNLLDALNSGSQLPWQIKHFFFRRKINECLNNPENKSHVFLGIQMLAVLSPETGISGT